MTNERENIWDKLENLDRRILFWVIVLVVAIPLVNPLGFPIKVSERVQEAYDFCEELLEPGDIVLIDLGTGVGPMPETMPGMLAIINQIMQHDGRIVFATEYGPEAVAVIEIAMDMTLRKDTTLVYGEDYVNFGFYSGGTTAVKRLASDWSQVFTRDNYGNLNEDLPIMEDIENAQSFKLVWHIGSKTAWITYWALAEDIPLCMTYMALMIPNLMPYYAAGDIQFLGGQRENAEYEILVGVPGPGVPAMDYQSLAHIFIILLVILGNAGYVKKRWFTKK